MCEQDELCGESAENCACNQASSPNAWRILDSFGDVRYTVYEESMALGIIIGHDGWTIQPVRINDPRW